ncbi:hypothetical protein VT84_24440 [Gemmata sp. SH-PL17]|uniref:hypothetical protein n=1 Tax=Gemmata sp. SH-PL17 TaxID=1630693 RepID=UPI00078D838F|nr:hypothetical protein [Gemmata sp. SH-PL17]AMV27573.1 hypothetical protein VT84_24440 [Gemmata sp. SH-PL17]
MRLILSALALAFLGVLAMPDTLPAQDDKNGTAVKITVKSWDARGKQFLKPQEDIEATKVVSGDRVLFKISSKNATGRGEPTTGSEITEADGTVHVVKKGSNSTDGFWRAYVEKKPVEKKP